MRIVYSGTTPNIVLAPLRQTLRAISLMRQSILKQMLTPKDYRGGTLNEPKGKLAVRMPGEPVDDRPEIVIKHPFWRDRLQQAVYQEITLQNPIKPGESRFQYIERLAEIARKEGA